MKIILNGETQERDAADVAALFAIEAEERSLPREGVAIALNGRVVRKKEWAGTPLAEGDRVEIVRAMQGG